MYIANLLKRLTDVGLLKWVGDKEEGFETKVGEFILKIFSTKRPVEKEGLFGKKKISIKDQWILRIETGAIYEELSGAWDSGMNYLWWSAYYSSQQSTSSALQGNLFLEILRNFKIQP